MLNSVFIECFFTGSSGQPVSDILGYSTIEKPIEALEKCLIWSHISPTAPDTLACYPYYETDPFVIEECPHVFFAGNQSEFDTKIYEGVNEYSYGKIFRNTIKYY